MKYTLLWGHFWLHITCYHLFDEIPVCSVSLDLISVIAGYGRNNHTYEQWSFELPNNVLYFPLTLIWCLYGTVRSYLTGTFL